MENLLNLQATLERQNDWTIVLQELDLMDTTVQDLHREPLRGMNDSSHECRMMEIEDRLSAAVRSKTKLVPMTERYKRKCKEHAASC